MVDDLIEAVSGGIHARQQQPKAVGHQKHGIQQTKAKKTEAFSLDSEEVCLEQPAEHRAAIRTWRHNTGKREIFLYLSRSGCCG